MGRDIAACRLCQSRKDKGAGFKFRVSRFQGRTKYHRVLTLKLETLQLETGNLFASRTNHLVQLPSVCRMGEAHHHCVHGDLLLELVLRGVFTSTRAGWTEWFALIPVFVMKGEIWQVVTYSLLHADFSHLFFNMLTLWFIGAYLERDWGPRRFIECYMFCVVGAALVTIAVAYTHFLGMDPRKAAQSARQEAFSDC